jgi:hypothetical protein
MKDEKPVDIITRDPITEHSLKTINPFSLFATRTGDVALVRFWTADTSVSATLTFTVLIETGDLVAYSWTLSTSSQYGVNTVEFPFGEGYLLSADVRVNSDNVPPQTFFVNVDLFRGPSAGNTPLLTLLRGFVSTNHPIRYPFSEAGSVAPEPGLVNVFTVANPAAGTDISITVPAGVVLRIQSIKFVLTTSASVATRQVTIAIDDGVNTYFTAASPSTQIASQTVTYCAAENMQPQAAAAGIVMLPLPLTLHALQSHRLRTVTSGIQSGDQFSGIVYYARVFPRFYN